MNVFIRVNLYDDSNKTLAWNGTSIFCHLNYCCQSITLHPCTYIFVFKYLSRYVVGLPACLLVLLSTSVNVTGCMHTTSAENMTRWFVCVRRQSFRCGRDSHGSEAVKLASLGRVSQPQLYVQRSEIAYP